MNEAISETNSLPVVSAIGIESSSSWNEIGDVKKSNSSIVELGNNVIVDGDFIYDEWN